MATRVLFAMSRDGLFAKVAATVNKGGTPTVALLFSATIAVAIIWFGKTFDKVIAVVAFFFVANYALSFVSVFVLRRREPDKQRPYRAWGYPYTTALALVGSIAFLIGAVVSDLKLGSRDSIYALLLLAASYPVFRVVKLLTAAEKA
jgi:APA family basic amino acid/polyamine antiporter